MLPDFTAAGLLPEGQHVATWDDVADRFGFTPRRRRLLDGLLEAATNLHSAGARYLWLDGSFTTTKPDPDDFDCAWDPYGVDLAKADPVLTDPVDLRTGRFRQKAKYGGEFLAGHEWETGMPFQIYFQQDEDGNAKGIVRLDLRTLP